MIFGTAGDIMDKSAALCNDTEKQRYTYAAQFPYLEIALNDFKMIAQLNNVSVSNQRSSVLTVPAGTTVISSDTIPTLPTDLVSIISLYENSLLTGQFMELGRRNFLAPTDSQVNQFGVYAWNNNEITLPSAVGIVYLKMDYISTLFSTVVDENSQVKAINADSFLYYRTAALCSRYIGEDVERAGILDSESGIKVDQILGIENKSKQGMSTRRRPFRASYKSLRGN